MPNYSSYEGTTECFLRETDQQDRIYNLLLQEHRKSHTRLDPGQRESWKEEPAELARLLRMAEATRDQFIALEYSYPLLQEPVCRRMDALICGKDVQGISHAIVLELKRWQRLPLRKSEEPRCVQVRRDGEWKDELHPSEQAERYKRAIRAFVKAAEKKDPIHVHSYTWLYKCNPAPPQLKTVLFDTDFDEIRKKSPLYTTNYLSRLANRIWKRTRGGTGEEVFIRINKLRDSLYEILDAGMRRYGGPPTVEIDDIN